MVCKKPKHVGDNWQKMYVAKICAYGWRIEEVIKISKMLTVFLVFLQGDYLITVFCVSLQVATLS
jgi:hypothetical protein